MVSFYPKGHLESHTVTGPVCALRNHVVIDPVCCFFVFLEVLRLELRTSCMFSKLSTTEP